MQKNLYSYEDSDISHISESSDLEVTPEPRWNFSFDDSSSPNPEVPEVNGNTPSDLKEESTPTTSQTVPTSAPGQTDDVVNDYDGGEAAQYYVQNTGGGYADHYAQNVQSYQYQIQPSTTSMNGIPVGAQVSTTQALMPQPHFDGTLMQFAFPRFRLVPASGVSQAGSSIMGSAQQLSGHSMQAASNKPRIPRPPNSFILYRKDKQHEFLKDNPKMNHKEISRLCGEMWQKESEEVKELYRQKALEEKKLHAEKYPGYKLTRRTRTRKTSIASTSAAALFAAAAALNMHNNFTNSL